MNEQFQRTTKMITSPPTSSITSYSPYVHAPGRGCVSETGGGTRARPRKNEADFVKRMTKERVTGGGARGVGFTIKFWPTS